MPELYSSDISYLFACRSPVIPICFRSGWLMYGVSNYGIGSAVKGDSSNTPLCLLLKYQNIYYQM
jgi:hypothetical protein